VKYIVSSREDRQRGIERETRGHSMHYTQPEPVAIVGIGCRFPGASSALEFWKLLKEGRDVICDMPADRWQTDNLVSAGSDQRGKIASLRGGFLAEIDGFDWRAFRIPPREAKHIDPQHRLLLEVAWEALEDAGIALPHIAGSDAGVFVGISWNDYLRLQSRNWSQLNGYTITGNCSTLAANRISYFFDLKGPSFALDAGCASSHVALQCACQYLWSQQGNIALVGGVNMILDPSTLIMVSEAGLLSRQGYCKTLDVHGDGFVFGEGAGMLVLKPLSQVSRNERIYALIRSIEVNHNGHNEWIMGTSLEAQKALIQRAYERAGIDPQEVDYVELHGTGFPRGDAIETRALGEVLAADGKRTSPCYIGALKPNMGNLASAAGVAGIMKVALSLYYREIAPMINLEQVNPSILLSQLQLAVSLVHRSWPDTSGIPVAGVTALSFTGANAHAVLTAAPSSQRMPVRDTSPAEGQPLMLVLSAHSEQALMEMAAALRQRLDEETASSWYDICYTSCVRRNHLRCRLAIPARSSQEAIVALEAFIQGTLLPGVSQGNAQEGLVSDAARLSSAHSVPLEEDRRLSALIEAGQLYVQGHQIDWSYYYPHEGYFVSFPPYPWQRERLWLDWLGKAAICTPPEANGNAFAVPAQEARKRDDRQLHIVPQEPAVQKDALVEYATQQIKALLDIAAEEYLSPQERLFDVGLTSFSATQFIRRLQEYVQRPLSVTLLFRYPTIDSLCTYLTQRTPEVETAAEIQTETLQHVSPDIIAQIDENEIEAVLLQKLAEIDRRP
jgi:acyl transferase domain-containing protein